MLPYHLQTLGTATLVGPDGDVVRLRTRKHFALLIYLACEPPRPIRRDRLAHLLWSTAETDEARHSLATALSILKGRLGPDAFDNQRDTVRLLPGRITTDLAALERAEPDDPELARIGPFLHDFEVPDAPEFALWCDARRAQLLPRLHSFLGARIERARRTGDARQMAALADQLHAVDELSEEGIRAVLESRALAGDRIGALREYERWRARLADELGAVPSPNLDRLADRLRRRGLVPSTTPLAPLPTEQWKERIFIGRAAEYAVGYSVWEQVRRGETRHLLVRGTHGVGKTTLTDRLLTTAAIEGAAVVRVACFALERELPYGVIGALVTKLLDLPGSGTVAPEQLSELGMIVPKVRQRWPSLPPAPNARGEDARIRFTEAVMALLETLAVEHPVAIVIDDLHLADVASLTVLHLILRRLEGVPVMFVLTSSSIPNDEDETARKFSGHPEALQMELLPLGELRDGEMEALLDALLFGGDDPGATARQAMLRAARGNPMVLDLLVQDWHRCGTASLALSLGAMTVSANGPREGTWRALVDAILTHLEPESRAVAHLGAVLGARLNDLGMYTLVDLPVARTIRALGDLVARHLLRDAGDRLEFASEFVRSQVYLAIPGPMRRLLHSVVADRLLAAEASGEAIPGLEMAWHLVRADRLAQGTPYLLDGARSSIRLGAPHEADLALSTGLNELRGQPRRTAILLLAEALQELGRWADALRLLVLSKEEFSQAELDRRTVLILVSERWSTNLSLESNREALATLTGIACTSSDIEARARAIAATPYFQSQIRDGGTNPALREAMEHLLSLEIDPYERLHLLFGTAWWLDQLHERERAERLLREAHDIIERGNYRSTIAVRVLVGIAMMENARGRYDQSVNLLAMAYAYAKKLDNHVHRSVCAASLGVAYGRLGNTAEQVSWSKMSLQCLREDDWGIIPLAASYELSLGFAIDGRDAEARAALDALEQRIAKTRPEWFRQTAWLMRADVLHVLGEQRRALKVAQSALNVGNGRLLLPEMAGPYARWATQVAIHKREFEAGAKRMAEVLELLPKLQKKDSAEVLGAAAMLAAARGLGGRDYWNRYRRELMDLPSGVTRIFRCLGITEPTGPTTNKRR
jgi:DNA-binding SARP family transcriptional activator/tetratricopeptide (TPR) repeat protein